MKKQTSKLRWMAAALAVAGMMTSASAADRRPNMVLFLVDVMGWMDSGVYGSEYYKTPNIDRLITKGCTSCST